MVFKSVSFKGESLVDHDSKNVHFVADKDGMRFNPPENLDLYVDGEMEHEYHIIESETPHWKRVKCDVSSVTDYPVETKIIYNLLGVDNRGLEHLLSSFKTNLSTKDYVVHFDLDNCESSNSLSCPVPSINSPVNKINLKLPLPFDHYESVKLIRTWYNSNYKFRMCVPYFNSLQQLKGGSDLLSLKTGVCNPQFSASIWSLTLKIPYHNTMQFDFSDLVVTANDMVTEIPNTILYKENGVYAVILVLVPWWCGYSSAQNLQARELYPYNALAVYWGSNDNSDPNLFKNEEEVVFSDDFKGNILNRDNWEFRSGGPSNVVVEDSLTLTQSGIESVTLCSKDLNELQTSRSIYVSIKNMTCSLDPAKHDVGVIYSSNDGTVRTGAGIRINHTLEGINIVPFKIENGLITQNDKYKYDLTGPDKDSCKYPLYIRFDINPPFKARGGFKISISFDGFRWDQLGYVDLTNIDVTKLSKLYLNLAPAQSINSLELNNIHVMNSIIPYSTVTNFHSININPNFSILSPPQDKFIKINPNLELTIKDSSSFLLRDPHLGIKRDYNFNKFKDTCVLFETKIISHTMDGSSGSNSVGLCLSSNTAKIFFGHRFEAAGPEIVILNMNADGTAVVVKTEKIADNMPLWLRIVYDSHRHRFYYYYSFDNNNYKNVTADRVENFVEYTSVELIMLNYKCVGGSSKVEYFSQEHNVKTLDLSSSETMQDPPVFAASDTNLYGCEYANYMYDNSYSSYYVQAITTGLEEQLSNTIKLGKLDQELKLGAYCTGVYTAMKLRINVEDMQYQKGSWLLKSVDYEYELNE